MSEVTLKMKFIDVNSNVLILSYEIKTYTSSKLYFPFSGKESRIKEISLKPIPHIVKHIYEQLRARPPGVHRVHWPGIEELIERLFKPMLSPRSSFR